MRRPTRPSKPHWAPVLDWVTDARPPESIRAESTPMPILPHAFRSTFPFVLAGLAASAVACSTTEASKPSSDEPSETAPKGDDDEDDTPPKKSGGSDGPAADRSVKGTWEKVSVHIDDGDPLN